MTFPPPPTPRKAEEPPTPAVEEPEPEAAPFEEPPRGKIDEELFARIRRESDARMAKRDDPAPGADAEFGGHRYRLYTQRMTWHQAKRFCEEQGGHLVTITSAEEQRFVGRLAGSSGRRLQVWLGITDEGHDRRWEWVTGEELVFQAWVRGDPSPGERENYARLISNAQWADVPASARFSVVCEWEGVPAAADPPEQAP